MNWGNSRNLKQETCWPGRDSNQGLLQYGFTSYWHINLLGEGSSEDGKWLQLVQDHIFQRVSVLTTLNIQILTLRNRKRFKLKTGTVCFKVLAHHLPQERPEGKRPLRRPRSRWMDNIRMDLGKVGWGDVDWIGLAKDRNRWRALVNSVLNLWVPRNAGKLSSGLASSGLSSSVQLHIVS
jgi:hypothetical protein